MPSIQLSQSTYTISAVSYGQLTVTAGDAASSIANLFSGMVGYCVGPLGVPASTKIVIQSVVSSGVINCLVMPWEGTSGVGTSFDFTAYNGGTLYFEAQLANVTSLYLDVTSQRGMQGSFGYQGYQGLMGYQGRQGSQGI